MRKPAELTYTFHFGLLTFLTVPQNATKKKGAIIPSHEKEQIFTLTIVCSTKISKWVYYSYQL